MPRALLRGGATRDLDLLLGAGALAHLSDGELLDRFVSHRDEAAVAALVGRHGGMVLGVCRRILGHAHDADDAFQATFLVLARRAGSVRPSDQVARWLHGVALQTARKARALRGRRLGREVAGAVAWAEVAAPTPNGDDPDHADRLARLDRAIAALPGRYRAPVVLCLLEGRTHREAADLLGCPVGTVSGRLSRARALLTRRVRAAEGGAVRPGLVPLPAVIAPALAPGQATATIRAMTLWGLGRPALTTVEMAPILLLTREVIHTMTLSKLRLLGLLALSIALTIAGAVRLVPAASDGPGATTGTSLDENAPTPDLGPLQGRWVGTLREFSGHPYLPGYRQPAVRIFEAPSFPTAPPPGTDNSLVEIAVQGDRLFLQGFLYGGPVPLGVTTLPMGPSPEAKNDQSLFRVTASYPTTAETDSAGRVVARRVDQRPDQPRLIDLTAAPQPDDVAPTVFRGLYQVEGDTLRLALSLPNKRRPTRLATEAGTGQALFTFQRPPGGSQAGPSTSSPNDPDYRFSWFFTGSGPSDVNISRPTDLSRKRRARPAPATPAAYSLAMTRLIQQAARNLSVAKEVTPDLIAPLHRLLELDPATTDQAVLAPRTVEFPERAAWEAFSERRRTRAADKAKPAPGPPVVETPQPGVPGATPTKVTGPNQPAPTTRQVEPFPSTSFADLIAQLNQSPTGAATKPVDSPTKPQPEVDPATIEILREAMHHLLQAKRPEPAPAAPAPEQHPADRDEIRAQRGRDLFGGKFDRTSLQAVAVPRGVVLEPELVEAVGHAAGSCRVVRTDEVTKDAMIISYLPLWDRGDVDNLGIANNHGGVRTLIDWPPVPTSEATDPHRRFFLAVYARSTHTGPKDPDLIQASELLEEWPERVSWQTKPEKSTETAAAFPFQPGVGWKLLDITSLIQGRQRQNRVGRGVALRFILEEPDHHPTWSGYDLVSREAEGEWRWKRPQLLVVEPAESAPKP